MSNSNSNAWAWVMQNSELMGRLVKHHTRGTSLAVEDFRHELILDLVEKFHKYDPARSKPSTWIWMRCVHVRRSMTRSQVRGHGSSIEDYVNKVAAKYGAPGQSEAHLDINRILAVASPEERAAADSFIEGWTREEVKASTGLTVSQRNKALRRMGERSEVA